MHQLIIAASARNVNDKSVMFFMTPLIANARTIKRITEAKQEVFKFRNEDIVNGVISTAHELYTSLQNNIRNIEINIDLGAKRDNAEACRLFKWMASRYKTTIQTNQDTLNN